VLRLGWLSMIQYVVLSSVLEFCLHYMHRCRQASLASLKHLAGADSSLLVCDVPDTHILYRSSSVHGLVAVICWREGQTESITTCEHHDSPCVPLYFSLELALKSKKNKFSELEPSGGASGQASDIAIHAKEILRIRQVLTGIYQRHCQKVSVPGDEGQKVSKFAGESVEECLKRFETALERDYFMTGMPLVVGLRRLFYSRVCFTAEEALEFGIVDEILEKRKNPI
jgi:hypothetical protein